MMLGLLLLRMDGMVRPGKEHEIEGFPWSHENFRSVSKYIGYDTNITQPKAQGFVPPPRPPSAAHVAPQSPAGASPLPASGAAVSGAGVSPTAPGRRRDVHGWQILTSYSVS